MKRVFLILIATSMVLVSCKKDENSEMTDPVIKSDYMQLKIGNYWVYHRHMTNTNKSSIDEIDSLVITGDTMIDGKQYFKKKSFYQGGTSYLRDSNGYLVDHLGKIMFSDHDFGHILRTDSIGPGLAVAEYSMIKGDTTIVVPSGSYPALDYRGKVTALDPNYPHGINYTYYFYADGFGMVKSSTYFFMAPNQRIEQELIDFGNNLE
ncbi:MAG: hypothetical protein V2I47_10410 [Bacteroidales bacterium]|jgi:hypothetical protein|nr:hypothetical protein [Bacteroidales bacterium]